MNSWCGCLRPPCGGTLATVPSRIFSSACCTPSPRNVAGDRRVFALAGNLVDFIDVDDAALGQLHIVIRRLDQSQQDVLHILADIAGLGQGGRVRDRKRNVQNLSQRLRQQRLAASRSGRASGCWTFAAPRRRRLRHGRCACSGCRPQRKGRSSPSPDR